jgi:hypothetical protein
MGTPVECVLNVFEHEGRLISQQLFDSLLRLPESGVADATRVPLPVVVTRPNEKCLESVYLRA